jgi:hypothetical protein
MSENWNLPTSRRMSAGVFGHVRPALMVAFILVFMLWCITASASFNTSIFRPPEPGASDRAPQSVPEPASLTILATGAAAAWLARRRRK